VREACVLDLADCTEFRQALAARPPGVVHGAALLLVALLGAALGWSALTRADLVVRAPGRVRPVVTPVRVFPAARGEALSASTGGRVAAVHFREGDEVRRGAVLIQLETGRLDHEIARKRRIIDAVAEELTRLSHLEGLASRQFEAARAKAEAELAQAHEDVRWAEEQRAAEIRLAQVALATAEQEETVARRLVERAAGSREELTKAVAKAREAHEQLAKARIRVDESAVAVAQRVLELAGRDDAVKREELASKREAKRAEVEAARIELASLELERQQATLRTPIDGIVTAGDVKVGDVLEPGKAVAELAPQAGFLFEAAVPSEEIGHVRTGMPARIKLDAFDYQRYGTAAGTVCFVSADSGVRDQPLDSGDRAAPQAVTYTVRIALSGDVVGRGAYRGTIKLGMAGQAEVVTGRESLLSLLVKRIRQTISLG
jgi:multidrug resistance efflux pump